MLEVAHIVKEINEKDKEFLKELLKVLGGIGAFALAVVAAIFGVKGAKK